MKVLLSELRDINLAPCFHHVDTLQIVGYHGAEALSVKPGNRFSSLEEVDPADFDAIIMDGHSKDGIDSLCRLLAVGKHVLHLNPGWLTVGDYEQLQNTSNASSGVFMPAVKRSFTRYHLNIVGVVSSGEIGRPAIANLTCFPSKDENVPMFEGLLCDQLHGLGQIFGEALAVTAIDSTREGVHYLQATIEFGSGAMAVVDLLAGNPGERIHRIEICGDRGVLQSDDHSLSPYRISGVHATRPHETIGLSLHHCEITEIVQRFQSVVAHEPEQAARLLAEGKQIARLVEAVRQSIESGDRVQI